NGYENPTYK
nr:Chain D, NGYENPTYK peptide [synthetic construct]1M7E_E Chain E, NGYENPTYK peptide [synthetic construct]1M7E_F Chain F, NGYENPTYK peptide [synthetic construct]1OQN_C Chain C, Alzheimer's disease amyloid A4 protein homolog [synthetic construct]1OQN_D Chain D, Alzheimer's disease amyloid A4 protein homolog [synthetic construct]